MTSHRYRRDLGPMVYTILMAGLARHHTRFRSLAALCAHLGLDRSIPARWKAGTTPSLATYLVVVNELAQLDADGGMAE